MSDVSLTNLVAFHTQQCIEKCFKALAEENAVVVSKTHDLIKLFKLINPFIADINMEVLYDVNELYIDSRYPGEMGLMPNGKPSITEAEEFIDFAEKIYLQIKNTFR